MPHWEIRLRGTSIPRTRKTPTTYTESINKAATYRNLAIRFVQLPKVFVFKMTSFLAVLARLGLTYLRGLMPLANYQGSLEIVVAEHIAERPPTDFEPLENPAHVERLSGLIDLVVHSVQKLLLGGLLKSGNRAVQAAKLDYAAVGAVNSSLGLTEELKR